MEETRRATTGDAPSKVSRPPRAPGEVPLIGTDFDPSDIVVGRIVSEQRMPNLERVEFRVLPGRHATLGSILGIRGTNRDGQPVLSLLRVDGVREHNPHEDALGSTVADVIPFETRYSPEGQSTIIYRLAQGELLEEALLNEAGELVQIRSIESLPLSGSPVVEVPADLVSKALNMAPDPGQGFHVGAIPEVRDLPAILDRSTIQTHMLFVGGIGRGKSYARGVVAEELASHGIPQINIDPMGEMVETTAALKLGMNVRPGEAFSLPLSALTAADVLDAIPGINKKTNYATLIAYAHESLLQTRVHAQGRHFTVDELVERIETAAPRLEMTARGTLMPAMQRARRLNHIDYIGEPFGWEEVLVPGRLINIDCRGRSVSDLRLITASVARDIQRLARARRIPFVVLSVDEAHLIAPNDDTIVTTQVLREIARIGRHYRIGLILTTQSPADMDRSVLKRLLTRFIFAIEPDQLESLRGVFADAPEAVIRHLPKLGVGTCVLTGVSETVKHATMVDIRPRRTPVGGTTPDIFAELAHQGWPTRRKISELLNSTQESSQA